MTSGPLETGRAGDALLAALDATIARARQSPLYAERLANVRLHSLEDFRAIPPTTRTDLQRAGAHGTRAVPLEAVCHYQESSGTTGVVNSAWWTADDLARDARSILSKYPEVFRPGRIILNRFQFMAMPAHYFQWIARHGGGVTIAAGNINWDVPFPRALQLARWTGAHVLAGMPFEPTILAEIARAEGIDPARDLPIDTLVLGGAALPAAMQARLRRVWNARVIELYGATETMLLATSCESGTLHFDPDLAHTEVLDPKTDAPTAPGETGRLVATPFGLSGSPLVRYETGDFVRWASSVCACGRWGVTVLGRESDILDLCGRRLSSYELLDAGAAAADALDSGLYFIVVLPDRLLVRIEARQDRQDPAAAFSERLPGVRVEIERLKRGMLLDVEMFKRGPRIYKPTLVSDWRNDAPRILTVIEGMIQIPRPSWSYLRAWCGRTLRTMARRMQLARAARRGRRGITGGAPVGDGSDPSLRR